MVWKNPVNGRNALYLASHAYAVEGMDAAAGKKLIDELTASRDRAGRELRAQMAKRRRGDVGQPRHHASRAAVAGGRAAADGAHDDFRDRSGRPRDDAPAVTASGRNSGGIDVKGRLRTAGSGCGSRRAIPLAGFPAHRCRQ